MTQTAPGRPFRVISFDGGGLHALSYLPVLRDIESHLGCPLAVSHEFDLFVGTSTGAIVATAFKLGATADEIIKMYRQHAVPIFHKTALWNWLFFSYSSNVLRTVLAEFYRNRTSSSVDLTWRQLAEESRFSELELVVTLWDVCRERTAFLSTNLNRGGQAEHLWDAALADIITACCSGPYFFPPRMFGKDTQVFCDGGITGLNNPATFGVSLVSSEQRGLRRPIDVLSFGSGETSADYSAGSIRNRSAVKIALNTIDALMNSSSRLMDQFHGVFGPALGIRRYLRTNHPRKPGSKLDHVAGIPEFVTHFERGNIGYELAAIEGDHPVVRKRAQPTAGQLSEWRRLWSDEFLLGTEPSPPDGIKSAAALRDGHAELRAPGVQSQEVLPSMAALSLPILFVAAVVGFFAMSGIAFWQWNVATKAKEAAQGAVSCLLQDDLSRFSRLPQKLSKLVVLPLKGDFPFHDAKDNERLKQALTEDIHQFDKIRNTDLEKHLTDVLAELDKWETKSPPHPELRMKSAAAALIFLDMYEEKSKESLSGMSPAYRDEEIRLTRVNAYFNASKVIQRLVEATDLRSAGPWNGLLDSLDGPPESRHPYLEFYRFYYGGLLIVESKDVNDLMIELGRPRDIPPKPLVEWASKGKKPESFNDLAQKLLNKINTELKQNSQSFIK